MLNISVELMEALQNPDVKKELIIKVNGETLENVTLGSFNTKDAICSQKNIKYGLCESSSIEFECDGITDLSGKEIKAYYSVTYQNESGDTLNDNVPIGSGYYTVDSCKKISGTTKRKVIAYDAFAKGMFDRNYANLPPIGCGPYGLLTKDKYDLYHTYGSGYHWKDKVGGQLQLYTDITTLTACSIPTRYWTKDIRDDISPESLEPTLCEFAPVRLVADGASFYGELEVTIKCAVFPNIGNYGYVNLYPAVCFRDMIEDNMNTLLSYAEDYGVYSDVYTNMINILRNWGVGNYSGQSNGSDGYVYVGEEWFLTYDVDYPAKSLPINAGSTTTPFNRYIVPVAVKVADNRRNSSGQYLENRHSFDWITVCERPYVRMLSDRINSTTNAMLFKYYSDIKVLIDVAEDTGKTVKMVESVTEGESTTLKFHENKQMYPTASMRDYFQSYLELYAAFGTIREGLFFPIQLGMYKGYVSEYAHFNRTGDSMYLIGNEYEEYTVQPVGRIYAAYHTVQTYTGGYEEEEKIYDSVFGGQSIYNLSDNAILKNNVYTESDFSTYIAPHLSSLESLIGGITYTPSETEVPALPYLQPGDMFETEDGNVGYILQKESTFTRDLYTCTGDYINYGTYGTGTGYSGSTGGGSSIPSAPSNAEKNVIVGIQKNGEDLEVDDERKVNIEVPEKAEDVGALPEGGTALAAQKLETARTINGVSFDGTADISIPTSNRWWVGSNNANTSGWYKFLTYKLLTSESTHLVLSVTNMYVELAHAILWISLKGSGSPAVLDTSQSYINWMYRNSGFNADDVVAVANDDSTVDFYIRQPRTQYGCIMFQVISEGRRNGEITYTTYSYGRTPLTERPTATVTSKDGGTVLKAYEDVNGNNIVDTYALKSVLTSAGIDVNSLSSLNISENFTFANLIAKNTITFFTNWNDTTNFPVKYGSGVLIPYFDSRYRMIIYAMQGNLYLGYVTVSTASVSWKNIPNQDAVVQSKSAPTYSTLKAFVEATATGAAMSYGFRFKDTAGWTPYIGWWKCWVQYQNGYKQSTYQVTGNVILLGLNNDMYIGLINGNASSDFTVVWKKIATTEENEGTTVWENADISAGLGATTISIAATGYTKYEVIYKTNSNECLATTGKIPIGYSTFLNCFESADNVFSRKYRNINVTSSKITIGSGYKWSNEGITLSGNEYVVPYKVILYP